MSEKIYYVDNFLSDPNWWVNYCKSLDYYSNENKPIDGIKLSDDQSGKPIGYWRGFRSANLSNHHTSSVVKKALIDVKEFDISVEDVDVMFYTSYTPGSIEYYDSWWHKDVHNSLGGIAGVVYLNPNPNPTCGTLFDVDNKVVLVENVFNRLLLYDASITHRPACVFGDTIDQCRLTLVFYCYYKSTR